jgi:hypothetical protein
MTYLHGAEIVVMITRTVPITAELMRLGNDRQAEALTSPKWSGRDSPSRGLCSSTSMDESAPSKVEVSSSLSGATTPFFSGENATDWPEWTWPTSGERSFSLVAPTEGLDAESGGAGATTERTLREFMGIGEP